MSSYIVWLPLEVGFWIRYFLDLIQQGSYSLRLLHIYECHQFSAPPPKSPVHQLPKYYSIILSLEDYDRLSENLVQCSTSISLRARVTQLFTQIPKRVENGRRKRSHPCLKMLVGPLQPPMVRLCICSLVWPLRVQRSAPNTWASKP